MIKSERFSGGEVISVVELSRKDLEALRGIRELVNSARSFGELEALIDEESGIVEKNFPQGERGSYHEYCVDFEKGVLKVFL